MESTLKELEKELSELRDKILDFFEEHEEKNISNCIEDIENTYIESVSDYMLTLILEEIYDRTIDMTILKVTSYELPAVIITSRNIFSERYNDSEQIVFESELDLPTKQYIDDLRIQYDIVLESIREIKELNYYKESFLTTYKSYRLRVGKEAIDNVIKEYENQIK